MLDRCLDVEDRLPLIFAYVEEVLVPAHGLAARVPSDRPDGRCPACGGRVRVRAGSKTPHWWHPPGSNCSPAPETELHFNTKVHIAQQLEGYWGCLRVVQQCFWCKKAPVETVALEAWDAVEVEGWEPLSARTPDVVLGTAGRAALAIEVRVTHPVDAAKVAAFDAAGVAWIEVEGDELLYSGSAAWTPQRPLAVVAGSMGAGVCEGCRPASEAFQRLQRG